LNSALPCCFRHIFAYTLLMQVGGHNQEPDWIKLGPSLVVAASLVLAIRTAKWNTNQCATTSAPEWDAEVDRSIQIARRVLSHLLAKCPHLFPSKNVPWYQPSDDDAPK
jgi:hypothetical protein